MIGEGGGASDFTKKEVWITRNTRVLPRTFPHGAGRHVLQLL